MKQKPMLLCKIKGIGLGRGREVIGLVGTHHGVGVTHFGLMLAFYMSEELGKKTALLECNNHDDLSLIQTAYEWSEGDARSFSFHQITCRKKVTLEQIPIILGGDYECLILDFGTDFNANREEFLRCTTKIVIGGRAEWDQLKLLKFIEASTAIKGSDFWQYFIPHADDKTVIKISNLVKRRVFSVPTIIEPTIPSSISYRFFKRFFPS